MDRTTPTNISNEDEKEGMLKGQKFVTVSVTLPENLKNEVDNLVKSNACMQVHNIWLYIISVN